MLKILIIFILTSCINYPAMSGKHAYVANEGSGNVSVIDTEQKEIIDTLPSTGKFGKKIQKIMVNKNETFMYILDAKSDALIIFDLFEKEIKKIIPVGGGPEGMSFSPSGHTIAVCLEDEHAVSFIDIKKQEVSHKVSTRGKNPEHCEYINEGKYLLTSNEETDDVDVIDTKTNTSIALIKTSVHPRGIAYLAKKNLVYIAQEKFNKLDIIDATTWQVISSVDVGLRASGVIISPDGSKVYVSNGGDGTVSVIATDTQQVIHTIKVGQRPWNMAISSSGEELYVANGRSNEISVVDLKSHTTIKSIPVGKLPWGVYIP